MIENFTSSSEYARNLFKIEDEKILEIEKEAIEQNIPIITREVLNFMLFMAKNNNSKNILEIGSATGYSGIFLAKICKENKGILTTIEIDEKRYLKAKENFEKVNLEENIDIILGDALEVLPTISKKFDFIFLDAAKSKYELFFEKAFNLLNENGYIFIDNLMFRGYVADTKSPKRYSTIHKRLNHFIENLNQKYNFVLLPFGDGVGIVKK